MKFARFDSDILAQCPRSVELIDGKRVILYALKIFQLKNFLNVFLKLFDFDTDKTVLQGLIDCKNDFDKLRNYLITHIPFSYEGSKLVVKPDIVDFYWKLQDSSGKTIQVLDYWDALVTIIEQNQLIEIISSFLADSISFHRQTYTNSFNIVEIMELGLVPDLTLLNWEEKLTHEQRLLYTDLVEQKRKKQIEIHYLATVKAISDNFNDKNRQNLTDFLFPMSDEEREAKKKMDFLQHLEKNRKDYMKEMYTGNKQFDDIWLLDYLKDKPHVNLERFFTKEEIEAKIK